MDMEFNFLNKLYFILLFYSYLLLSLILFVFELLQGEEADDSKGAAIPPPVRVAKPPWPRRWANTLDREMACDNIP